MNVCSKLDSLTCMRLIETAPCSFLYFRESHRSHRPLMQFNALEKEAKRVNNEHITGLCDRVTSFPQIMNYYEFTVSNIKQ